MRFNLNAIGHAHHDARKRERQCLRDPGPTLRQIIDHKR